MTTEAKALEPAPEPEPEPEAKPEPKPELDRSGLAEVNPRIPFWYGPFAVIGNAFGHGFLIASFIARDLRIKFRNSILGYFWSLLEPLLLTGVYFVMFTVLAGKPERRYPLWVVLGVLMWGFFSRALMSAVQSLTGNGGMIKQVYFPRELFAITATGSQMVLTFLSLFVAVPFLIWLQIVPNIRLLMVPAALLMTAMLGMGIGWLTACFNAVNRDVEYLFKFITRAGMFLSPVLWTVEMIPRKFGGAIDLLLLNPMVVPITMVRNGIEGRPLGLETNTVIYSIVFTVVVFLFGAMVFKRFEAEAIKNL